MSASELGTFREKYGPDHFSEREEEWLIRDYFQDRKGGTFVDVGANHYKSASKTYYLESKPVSYTHLTLPTTERV